MNTAVQDKVAQDLTIRPLTEHTGSEVIGLDLSGSVDAETKRRLNEALVERICLVFRDQDLSPAGFLRAAEIFGVPAQQNYSRYQLSGQPLINELSNLQLGAGGKRVYHNAYWHTDHTNRECPPKCTVLYAKELPDSGGQTGILNARAAYEALPPAMKRRLDGLQTFNVQRGSAAKQGSMRHAAGGDMKHFETPTPHPLVRTHPETGTKAIFFHRGKVENITGMDPEESQDFLDEIMAAIERPPFIYKHEWRLGDVLIWDNRAALHIATPNYDLNQRRVLHRIILEGDRPF
jgi:taurine dioxygenase